MIDAFPGSDYAVEARVRTGECRARMEDYEGAIAECDRVLDEHPDSRHIPLALLIMGNILLFDTHDRDAAAAAYATLVDDHAGTRQAEEASIWQTSLRPKRVIHRGPGAGPDAETRSDPADELVKLGEYRAVLATSEDYKVRATSQYIIEYSHYLIEHYDTAIREGKKLLVEYPDTYRDQLAQTNYFVASMHESLEQYDLALTTLTAALRAYPKNVRVPKMAQAVSRVKRKAERAGRRSGQ